MRFPAQKKIFAIATGALLLVGATGIYIAQAAPQTDNRPAFQGSCQDRQGDHDGDRHQRMEQGHMDPDKVAGKIAETFGVDKSTLLQYHKQGVNFRDLVKASVISKASGKTLKQVLAARTYDNTWKDVANSLGATPEKIKAVRQDIAANMLQKKLNIAKSTSLGLLHEGYHPRDIAVANELAKNTGKPINDILGMRKINNTWRDVAKDLGVSDATFRQDMGNLMKACGGPSHHRQHDGEGMHEDGMGMHGGMMRGEMM
jgi:hypothetical protein